MDNLRCHNRKWTLLVRCYNVDLFAGHTLLCGHILLIFRTIRPHRSRAILHKFVHNYIYLQKKTTIISDMHHCITYMYILFQQNLVSRYFFQPYTTQTNMKVRTLKSRNKHWLCPIFLDEFEIIDWVN